MTSLKQALLAGLALCASALPTVAEYPEKPVEFVVPWPPGGEEDVFTRIIADTFQEMYGVSAAVINKPGGGGGPFPGAVEVAAKPADGYTVGSFVTAVPVVGPMVGIPELTPNPFEPVGIFMTYPFMIVAKGDAPYSTMEELAAYAQENDVLLGHFGAPAIPTRVTMQLADRLGFEWAADSAFDNLDCNTLASGDVDVMSTPAGLIGPCLQDLTVLATVTGERLAAAPDAPAVREIAPELDMVLWNGIFVREGTPQDVKDKIAAAVVKALKSPDAVSYAEANGVPLYWTTGADALAQIEADTESFKRLAGQ